MDNHEPDCRFVVPGLPKSKARARSRIFQSKKTGKPFISTYTPAETQNEEAVLRTIADFAMQGCAPFEGALDLRVSIFMAIPQSWSQRKRADALAGRIRPTKKPDWDNVGKLTDALNGIVWRDDSQISDAHVWKRFSDRPRVVIEVRCLEIRPPLPAVTSGIRRSPLVGVP